MSSGFDRAAERASFAKPFAYQQHQIAGATNGEIMNKNHEWKEANAAYRQCQVYATSYSAIMLQRTLAEEPDFLEERGTTKEEFLAHISNNLCFGLTKYRNHVFKTTVAGVQEEGYLNDKIRRLTNGGDRFHPYI